MDSREEMIRKRATAATEINSDSGARTCDILATAIPKQATIASLLLDAVDIARLACGVLNNGFADKNTKRAGILVLYPTNDDMVNDITDNLKDCGVVDVDVVACTENKEKFNTLNELVKIEGGSESRVEDTGERGGAKFACFLAHAHARGASITYRMFRPSDGNTPLLVDETTKRSLVVCVPIEGIQKEKLGKSDSLLDALTPPAGAYTHGFRIWSALSRDATPKNTKKYSWFFEEMKIPTLFHYSVTEAIGQKRKRDGEVDPDFGRTSGNPTRQKLSEEEKIERRRKYQERLQRHLEAEKNAAKLDVYFRYDRPGSKLKKVIDDITHWRLKYPSNAADVDDDVASWESQLSDDSPLHKTLKELRDNHLKWLRWLYFRAACKLRMNSGGLGPKPSEWPDDERRDLIWETCTQWIHSAGLHGSRLGAGYLISLLRKEEHFVDICAIAATNEQNVALLQTFRSAVRVITADYNTGLSEWGKLAVP